MGARWHWISKCSLGHWGGFLKIIGTIGSSRKTLLQVPYMSYVPFMLNTSSGHGVSLFIKKKSYKKLLLKRVGISNERVNRRIEPWFTGGVFFIWTGMGWCWNNCCNVDIVYICLYNQHVHNGIMGLHGYIMDYSMDYGWLMFCIIIFNAIRQTRFPKIDFRTQWIPADWDDLTWRLFPGLFKAPGLCLEKIWMLMMYSGKLTVLESNLFWAIAKFW